MPSSNLPPEPDISKRTFGAPVVNNASLRRFELEVGGETAFLQYSFEANGFSLDHTHVPDSMRGKGMGAALVRAAMAEAKRRGWEATARCAFVEAFLKKHPEKPG